MMSRSEFEPRRFAPCTDTQAAFADRHQPGDDGLGIAVAQGDDLSMQIGRHATHIVVDGRQHRDRLARDVDPGEDPRSLADAGQALMQELRAEMLEMQEDMVLARAAASPLIDLDRHGAADDVASREVLGARRIALHEALAFGIRQIAAFAARPR